MNEKIDINRADVDMLTTISGIGPTLAGRIVEYRETVHPFEEVIELAAVPGISEKMVRGFAEFVTVDPADASPAHEEGAEPILLGAPETPDLLQPPEQPEALLAAELPPEDEIVVADSLEAEGDETEETAASRMEEIETKLEASSTTEPTTDLDSLEAGADASPAPAASPVERPEVAQPSASPPPPSPLPSDWEAKAQRRGCINTLLGATFGAILGAALTLAILAAVNNGSINYAQSNRAMQQQLETEILSRTDELNVLSTRISLAATEEADANQALADDLAAASEAMEELLAENEEMLNDLADRADDLEIRLEEVSGAAETFNDFLDGLRLLLDDIEGAPESVETPTATPSAEDATGSPTPSPTPTALDDGTAAPSPTTAVQPTRTPQPTSTPFTFPTNTPAAQP